MSIGTLIHRFHDRIAMTKTPSSRESIRQTVFLTIEDCSERSPAHPQHRCADDTCVIAQLCGDNTRLPLGVT